MKKVILVVLFLLVTAPVCLSVESLEMGLDYSTEVGEKNWEEFQNAKTAQDYGKIIERMKELEARYENDPAAFAAAFESVFIQSQFHLLDTSIPGQKELQQYLLAQCRKIKEAPAAAYYNCAGQVLEIVMEIEPLLAKKTPATLRQWQKDRKENTRCVMDVIRARYGFLYRDPLEHFTAKKKALETFQMPEYTVPKRANGHDSLAENRSYSFEEWDQMRTEIPFEWIPDPQERKRYRDYLFEKKSVESSLQTLYRNYDEFQSKTKSALFYFLRNAYADTPEDLRELREILEEHHITKDFQEEILKCVKTAE